MNKEQLQERITVISNEMAQIKAQYAKLEGHLQEATHWLSCLCTMESEQQGVIEDGGQEVDLQGDQKTGCPA